MLHSTDSFLGSLPRLHALVEGPVVAALGFHRCPGDFIERCAQPAVGLAGADRFAFTGTFIVARAHPRPGTEMFDGGETRHIRANLRQDDLGSTPSDAWHGQRAPIGFIERAHAGLDVCIKLGDSLREIVDDA